MFTAEQLAEMNALPDYQPVSNFYAGGIDGVKTSGDLHAEICVIVVRAVVKVAVSALKGQGLRQNVVGIGIYAVFRVAAVSYSRTYVAEHVRQHNALLRGGKILRAVVYL